jgi:hypothetical protein
MVPHRGLLNNGAAEVSSAIPVEKTIVATTARTNGPVSVSG